MTPSINKKLEELKKLREEIEEVSKTVDPNGKSCVWCDKPLYGQQSKYCSKDCRCSDRSCK